MNKLKNCHYKSAVQTYNTAVQPFTATNIASTPLVLLLGAQVTETGVSIDTDSNGITIENGGLYRVSADVSVTGTVGGNAFVALTLDGVPMMETLRTQTLVADVSITVPLETIRYFNTCCQMGEHNIGVIIYSDGTATGSVTSVSVNAIKEA